MNLLELKEIVDSAVEHAIDPEKITVRIPTFMVGVVGHTPCTNVKTAYQGFDWESKSFIIAPEKQLREVDRDEIKDLRNKYDELGWSYHKINRIKRENEQLKKQLQDLKDSK